MRRVLITGSTQGIGKALATGFVKEGYEVIVHCSKDIEKAERIREEISAHKAVVCDLSNMDEVNGLYAQTGAVDCLILNASVQYKELWQDITDETFDKQFDINVKSTLKLMQAYYPAMQEKGFGRIVTIGSVNQYRQHSELSVYSATKCAVMKLVECIAKQVAPFGVTVNSIAPGAIVTPRNESVYNDNEKRKAVENCIPMGRFGESEEIAGAVLMLCSEQGSYITGTDIIIDGGMRL
jgi:NAD(P)-dependent dehydrogenase (short-subunit alcohol dehydrogenase family)